MSPWCPAFGERLVLRLLDKSGTLFQLEDIGFSRDLFTIYNRLIHRSHGIILVTGPTGSGKTTTLYGTLQRINSPAVNIITVEDPIEYQLNGIGQIQVNPRIDLTLPTVCDRFYVRTPTSLWWEKFAIAKQLR